MLATAPGFESLKCACCGAAAAGWAGNDGGALPNASLVFLFLACFSFSLDN